MATYPDPWFIEVALVDTGQPLVTSDWHHCPKRADYFSEDVEKRYATRAGAQTAADALNAANVRPWVRYGVGEVIEVIPADDTEAEPWRA